MAVLGSSSEQSNTVNLVISEFFAAIIKSADIYKSHQRLSNISGPNTSKLNICQSGIHYFYVTDSKYTFKIVPSDDWFQRQTHDLGGVIGLYWSVKYRKVDRVLQTILGLDTVLYDIKINENNHNFRKVGLHKSATGKVLLINY
jgi:hypothetical protein